MDRRDTMQVDLTQGSIKKSLLLFSVPMILGNLLQQLYNVADTLIVGQTIGATALSAVGSAYSLMVLLTSIMLGLCMGSGVVFAQQYGAKQIDHLKVSIVNAFVFILVITVILNLCSFYLLDHFIVWLQIPLEAVAQTKEYLHIIFYGLLAVFFYNFFASILRSIGNTVIPLIFLGISALLNIILDLYFILEWNMGVAGAAWATVLSQYVSAILIIFYFYYKAQHVWPSKQHLRMDGKSLFFIISNSSLTAIQQSIMNFGILMIQGLVNSFGFYVSAAFAAVVKIDGFAYMPAQDFGNAYATFIAQNYGAQRKDRIIQGTKFAIYMSILFCAAASAFVYFFAKPLMMLFVKASDIAVIGIGIQYLHIVGLCYVGIGILFLLYGFYRGIGKSQMSIILTVISLGTRVGLAYYLAAVPQIGLLGIWWAIPIGWLLADIAGLIVYQFTKQKWEN